MDEHYELYRKRQTIVEHPFGIIKRQWGFYYIMTKKTMKRASADVGLIFSAYNLKRIFNIISQEALKKYLKGIFSIFCHHTRHCKPMHGFKMPKLGGLNVFQTILNRLRIRETLIIFG